jgi:hypothetical protein
MQENDAFADRGRALENEYIRRKERELMEKLRRHSESQSKGRELAASVGIDNPEILHDLAELGYTRETIMLLYLVPLVHVAWSDGSVSGRERSLILETAASRGVEQGTLAYQTLTDWLDVRPTEKFFLKTLHLIGLLLQELPQKDQRITATDLVSYSTRVAEAHGGLLSAIGLGSKISGEERRLLERIATELEVNHPDSAKPIETASESKQDS